MVFVDRSSCLRVKLDSLQSYRPPPTNRVPRKMKLDVLNQGPTVLRAPGGLGDFFEGDALDSVA